ncbi:MAG: phytanoyl-CoA dioxygenase family protein [Gammaproteobacteria bacterium]|nr:phytanoyl-CoA dioxygenase family protein [Gammaproteobacteria bacterium]
MKNGQEVPAEEVALEAHSPYGHGDEDSKYLLEVVYRQGYVVLTDCIDAELLASVNARADELYAAQAKATPAETEQPESDGPKQAFLTNLVGRGPQFQQLLGQPSLIDMVTSILGEDCLLSSASMRDVYGGSEEQVIHTDDLLYAGREDWFKRPVPRQLSLVAAVAMADQVASRGTTVLFPGSHMWEESPDTVQAPNFGANSAAYNEQMRNWARKNKGTDAIDVEMKAGSVVIWLGATWHAGGAYTAPSGDTRRVAIFNFCRGIFRQQENQMAGITHEQAADMPQAVQKLLGYTMSDTGLGYSGGQDPAILLGEGGKALLADNTKRTARRRGK